MRPVWAEINLDNLRNNITVINNITNNEKIIGIIKADGYGHGAVQIARELTNVGVDFFGVACMDEAEELITNNIAGNILILGCTPEEDWEKAVKLGIRLTVCSKEEIDFLRKTGLRPVIHIKIDTGMGRVGFTPEGAIEAIKEIESENLAEIEGLFTHLSSSDDDIEYTKMQAEKFKEVEQKFPEIKYKHISNSGGVLNIKDGYNMIRPGIILYGVVPFESKYRELFKPVMQLKSKIVFVKKLEEDHFISYSKTYKAKKGTVIATIPVGYADGLSRSLSNKGEVEIQETKCKIIGRVCMDQTLVEIPKGMNIKVGEEVTLFGGIISVEELSEKADTIPYEILTCINKRVPRVYIKNGKKTEMKSMLGRTEL